MSQELFSAITRADQDLCIGDADIIARRCKFRREILTNGYQPIPVAGKNGLNPGWTSGEISHQRVIDETQNSPTMTNTGLRCGSTVCVDNDVIDPQHAAAVNEIVEFFLSPTPLKRYGSKGAALIYRNETPIGKLTITAADGTRLFEVLGTGQQFVGFGRHPAGMDYRWQDKEPSNYPLADLPEVTPDQLHELIATIRELLTELGYSLKQEAPKQPTPPKPEAATYDNDNHGGDQSPDEIRDLCAAALAVTPNDADREGWIDMCFAIRDAGLDLSDWRSWCDKWTGGTNTDKEILKAWDSCANPRSITFRTLLKAADDADPNWRARYYEPINKARREAYYEAECERIRREIAAVDGAPAPEPEIDEDEPEEGDSFAETTASRPPHPPVANLWPSADDDAAAEPPSWLIEDLIPDNANVLLSAPSGYLKSFVALDLIMSIATGKPALGTQAVPNPGPCFYFCGEGYHGVRTKRRAAWEIAHGFDAFKAPDVWFTGSAPLSDAEIVARYVAGMKDRLAGRQCKAFVVDTLTIALNGQEEDKAHVVGRYLNIASAIREQIGGTSITVHHFGKDITRGSRGSSAWEANVDAVLKIPQHHYDEDEGIHTISLLIDKQKDYDRGRKFFLQSDLVRTTKGSSLALVPITEETASAIFGEQDTEGKGKRPSYLSATILYQAIKELLPTGGHIGTGKLAEHIAQMTGKSKDAVSKILRRKKHEFARFVFGEDKTGILWTQPLDEHNPETREIMNKIKNIGNTAWSSFDHDLTQ